MFFAADIMIAKLSWNWIAQPPSSPESELFNNRLPLVLPGQLAV
jgi:hypothetical protein